MSLYAVKVKSYNPIAYWPGYEASGTSATCLINPVQSGTYTGVTLGQTGIGDDWTCPLYDGVNDVTNIYTTTFRDAFSGAAGSAFFWYKISGAGVLTDSTNRRLLSLSVDANNYILLWKTTANNLFRVQYKAGGTLEQTDSTITSTDWVHYGLTWDKNAGATGEVKVYVAGSQSGSTDTTLGTWAGNLDSSRTCIGASITTPADVWDGDIAHPAVWAFALNSTQIADLAVVPTAVQTAMSALTGVDAIAAAVQKVGRGLTGMRTAPKYPPEQVSAFPFVVSYPRGGELGLSDEKLLTNDLMLVTEIHLAGPDLASATERAYPYLERFLKAMMNDLTLSAAFNSGSILMPIRHRFGFLDYFGGTTIGWTFEIPIVTRGATS